MNAGIPAASNGAGALRLTAVLGVCATAALTLRAKIEHAAKSCINFSMASDFRDVMSQICCNSAAVSSRSFGIMIGISSTEPGQAARGLTLRELRIWTLLILGLSYWANVVRTYRHDGPISLASTAQSVLSDGAFNVAAWAMVAAWAARVAPSSPASRRQIACSLAIGLLCAVPTRQTTIAALVVLGVTLAIYKGMHHSREPAALLGCLAIEMVWTSTYLLPLHNMVARLDAAACGAILNSLGQSVAVHDNMLDNVQTGFSVEVLGPCASSFPLAGVLMAFLVTLLYCNRFLRVADLGWLAAALLASIALTEARLSLMATGEASYVWLHDQGGATVYTLLALALAVLFPVLAILRPQATVECIA